MSSLNIILKTLLSDFLAKRQLTPEMIAELRENNLQVLASTNVPLTYFSKEVVKNRDRLLLEIGGFNPEDVNKFDMSPETLKVDARKVSEDHQLIIRRTSRRIAEKGQLGAAIDHKAILNTDGQVEFRE